LKYLLAHPLTRGMDFDDPQTTRLRQRIIAEKPFLRKVYEEWYRRLAAALPPGAEPVLEVGTGPGFLNTLLPHVITSDVFMSPNVKIVLDAGGLPFSNGSLRSIVMTNVLHHLPEPRRFFSEAARCVREGGVVAMIEPWVTPWSALVFRFLHNEPFSPDSASWEFPRTGPLSGANNAMPWIIFERDREQFEREFPAWKIELICPLMPFCYLLSGGVTLRSLVPGIGFKLVRRLEGIMQPVIKSWAMFVEIRLRKSSLPPLVN
jgi:SAM-dependent methyltransferase